ncbi:MAG: TerC family protein [Deinococcales bacterium]
MLEIVLGIDNIVFISILSGKLPKSQQQRSRNLGLWLAMLIRIGLLFSISWIMSLTKPLFSVFGIDFDGKAIILIIGGLFLLAKSTIEIHDKLEGDEGHADSQIGSSFASVMFQMTLLNIVFSLDSVITAVGMVEHIEVMIAAVVISTLVMLASAGGISRFVESHPTVKMLALCFLLLIGMSLVAEGLHFHIEKGYIYFAMGFSVFVEMLNLQLRRSKTQPVHLRQPYTPDQPHF